MAQRRFGLSLDASSDRGALDDLGKAGMAQADFAERKRKIAEANAEREQDLSLKRRQLSLQEKALNRSASPRVTARGGSYSEVVGSGAGGGAFSGRRESAGLEPTVAMLCSRFRPAGDRAAPCASKAVQAVMDRRSR